MGIDLTVMLALKVAKTHNNKCKEAISYFISCKACQENMSKKQEIVTEIWVSGFLVLALSMRDSDYVSC